MVAIRHSRGLDTFYIVRPIFNEATGSNFNYGYWARIASNPAANSEMDLGIDYRVTDFRCRISANSATVVMNHELKRNSVIVAAVAVTAGVVATFIDTTAAYPIVYDTGNPTGSGNFDANSAAGAGTEQGACVARAVR